MQDKTLPREPCEWCGREVVYVRVYPKGAYIENYSVVPIDPEPTAYGDLGRIPAGRAGGRIDCVVPITALPAGTFKQSYRKHKDTCEHAYKWSGHKKWKTAKREPEERRTPELDRYPDQSGQITQLP